MFFSLGEQSKHRDHQRSVKQAPFDNQQEYIFENFSIAVPRGSIYKQLMGAPFCHRILDMLLGPNKMTTLSRSFIGSWI